MQHKFTKSLLATAILFGLTACGSSGGGGSSSEPTTKANNVVNTTNTTQANTASKDTATKSLTTIKDIEKLSGKATYTALLDESQSYINGEKKSGKVELTADFGQKNISGQATFDMDGSYVVRRQACSFEGQSACGSRRYYNYANATLKETLLTNNNGVLNFNGIAEGSIDEYGNNTNILGTYQGEISGENAETISGSITANSSAIYGVFNGTKTAEEKETISIPVVDNQSDNTETTQTETSELNSNTNSIVSDKTDTTISEKPIVTNWDTLPAIPELSSSRSSGYNTSNITGKATYFTQKRSVILNNNGKSYDAKLTPNTYAVLNADFDAKKVSGSAVTEFYKEDEKVGQSQIDFKETNLYRNGSYNLDFTGVSEGKIQVVGQDVQNATGSYDGSIDTYAGKATIKYELYSDNDRSLNIKDTKQYYSEELKKQ